jgi:hypothetical protein
MYKIMNRLNFAKIALISMGVLFMIAACSTTGMQRSEDVQSSLEIVDNDIKLILVQIDAIGASLDELTKPGQADVKKAYDLYSNNVSKIEKMEKDFAKHVDQMIASGNTYFDEWDNDKNKYQNPDLQRSSDERREALGLIYDKIGDHNAGLKEAFRMYVSDVTEIESYLSNDLTDKGITSIASLSDRTVQNGNRLNRELRNLQSAVEEVRAEMVQSGISMN